MQSSNPAFIESLLKQLEHRELTLEQYDGFVPEFTFEKLQELIPALFNLIFTDEEFFLPFLKKVLYHDQNEDRLTDVLGVMLTNTTEKMLETEWFGSLCTDFLSTIKSSILIDNFFIYTNELHNKYQFTDQSPFIKLLNQTSNNAVSFKLIIFLFKHQIWTEGNWDNILQRFKNADTDAKLDFIPILNTISEKDRLNLAKGILFDEQIQKEQMVILAILFHLQSELTLLFESYDKFEMFITKLNKKVTYELLFSEFVKPESVQFPWIQRLVLTYLKQNTSLSNFIIEMSGEYLKEWNDSFRETYLQLILQSYNNLKESLAKILSPVWFDEYVIRELLTNENQTVLDSLFESVITIYQLLSPELQETILKTFRAEYEYEKFLGLLLAYNFQLKDFYKEVLDELDDISDPKKKNKLSGILMGLGMKWVEIDDTLKTLIKSKIKIMTVALKKELKNGLELIYGLLNLEDMNLVTNLQSFDPNLEIPPDDIPFE